MSEHEVQCGNTSPGFKTRNQVNYGGPVGSVSDKVAGIATTLRNIGTVDSEIDIGGNVDSSGVSDKELVDENVESIEVDPWQVASDREATVETEDVIRKEVSVEEILSGFRFVKPSDMNEKKEEAGETLRKELELLVNPFNCNAALSNRSSFRGGSNTIDQNVLSLGLEIEINSSNDRKIVAKK